MSTGPIPQPSWLEQVDHRRDEASYGLVGLGAISAVLAVFFNYRSWDNYYVLVLALYWAAAVFMAAGLWFRFHDRATLSRSEATRILLLLLTGLIGIDLFLATFGSVYLWRETVFAGWEEWQGKGGWRIWVIALLAASGPALILLGLIATRSDEHSQPLLRRLFYGFNAVLAGQLVLLILLLLNVLGYVFLPKESDWTKSRLYTLTSKSQNLLKGLEK